MRILMISTDFLPVEASGIARHVLELSKALRGLGHEVAIFSVPLRDARAGRSTVEGVPVFRAGRLPYGLKSFRLAFRVGLAALWGRAFRRPAHLAHWHCPTRFEARAARAAYGAHRVFTNHTSAFAEAAAEGDEKRLAFYREAIQLADAVIAASQERAELTRRYADRPAKVVYIPNGVDTERFSPAAEADQDLRAQHGIGPHDPLVLTVARLMPVKGIEYLIAAMSSVVKCQPRARLLLVGDGPLRTGLVQQVAAAGLQESVVFAGERPNRTIPGYLRACDVAVLSSRIETTSLFALEAMASGKPLIGTRVGGIPELIEDGRTGILVEPGRPDELAEAICDLLASPERRLAMGAAGRERVVAGFTWRAIAERTAGLYESLVTARV